MTSRRRASLTGLVLCLLLLPALPASAGHIEIEVEQPGTVNVGDTVVLTVLVRSGTNGARVAGALVVATRRAEIAGFSGSVEIARAVTDENGIAKLSWRERSGTNETLVVAYAAPGENQMESEPLQVITVGPGPQLEGPESDFRIPGLGVWVLIAVLVGIWSVIQFALVGPIQVAADIDASLDEDAESGAT